MLGHSMWPDCERVSAEHTAPASAVLDFGLLTDAIHVSTGAHLEFQRLHVPNSGNRKLKHPSQHTRLHVAGAFALWPSVTLAQGSKVQYLQCSAAAPGCMLAICTPALHGRPIVSLNTWLQACSTPAGCTYGRACILRQRHSVAAGEIV